MIRIYLLISLLVLGVGNISNAQDDYFNKIDVNPNRLNGISTDIILHPEGFITTSTITQVDLGLKLSVDVWSEEGVHLQQLESVDGRILKNYADSFIELDDGYCQAGSKFINAWGGKFSQEGALEWQLELIDTLASASEFHNVTEVSDGSLLFAGPKHYNFEGVSQHSNLYLVKTTTDGDILWTRELSISENQFLRINGIFELEDGGFLLSGGVYQDWDNLLVKINSDGFIENTETDIVTWGNENVSDFVPWMVPIGNGEFMASFLIGESEVVGGGGQFLNAYIRAGFFNSNTMIFTEMTDDSALFAGHTVFDCIQTPDGGYAILGIDEWTIPQSSYIKKVDADLNEEWFSYYYYNEETHFRNLLYDIEITPDGGFICVGEAAGYDLETNPQSIWLLKLDACGDVEWNGCDTTFVDGMEEIDGSSFSIFPNPAESIVTFAKSDHLRGYNHQLTIRNTLGQKIFSQQLEASSTEFDISNFPPGVYQATLVSDGKEVYSQKLIVQ